MKNAFKVIIINSGIFFMLIVGTEAFCQLAYFVRHGNFLFLESDNKNNINNNPFEIHPYLVGRLKASVVVQNNKRIIKTTKDHTRWTGSNQDDNNLIRVAILGGSTTFGTGVTDEDSWPALLQSKLGREFSVTNYGIPGYSTAEAIIQMALIVSEKRPHIVIFYEGWNDIRNYHEKELGVDYFGHGIRQYENLGISVSEKKNNVFATVWLTDRVKSKFTKPPKNNIELFVTPDLFVDKIYLRNLKTLKLLAENIQAFSMFIPQILNYSSYSAKEGSRGWTRHIKDSALPILMERFNSHMKGLCSKSEENCVVLSEVTEEKWCPNDFVDDGHFSKNGGVKFTEIIAHSIRSKYESGIIKKGSQSAVSDLFSTTLHSRR